MTTATGGTTIARGGTATARGSRATGGMTMAKYVLYLLPKTKILRRNIKHNDSSVIFLMPTVIAVKLHSLRVG